jgi:hypothetical protein
VRNIESCVSGLLTVLQAGMDARLAAIEVARPDDATLDPPRLYLNYKPFAGEISEWPCVCVLAGRSVATADAGGWATYDHYLSIVCFLEDANPSDLALKLLRYQLAIIEVVAMNRTGVVDPDGASAWNGINVTGTEPGQRFQIEARGGVFGDYTVVNVRATRQEDYS